MRAARRGVPVNSTSKGCREREPVCSLLRPSTNAVWLRAGRHGLVALDPLCHHAALRENDSPMTRRHLMTLRLFLLLADGLVAWFVFLLVSAFRFGPVDPNAQWSVSLDIGLSALVFALVWVAVLWTMGLYQLGARWGLMAEARDLARATLAVLALTLSALFLLHQDDVSRFFLAILFVAQPLASLAVRAVARAWFEAIRRRSGNGSYMLIVGTDALAQAFADRVEARRELGLQVVGHLALKPASGGETNALTRPVLGTVDDIGQVFRTRVVDEVAICLPDSATAYLDPLIAIAADEGKTVRVPAHLEESVLTGALHEEFEGFLVRSVIHDGHRDLELAAKRLLDIVGAIVGLVLLSPLLLAIALLVRVREGSPVLFRQTRVGRHGRPFTIYKFRTMVPDAEDQFESVRHLNERNGAAFKATRDPRVTPMGGWLRKTSIDELPQLWNVLEGAMSLVGPRPPLPDEVAQYDIWHRRRLSMRPGVTGLWQVEARRAPEFEQWVERDLNYIDSWTLWLDLKILVRTVPAVLSGKGQ